MAKKNNDSIQNKGKNFKDELDSIPSEKYTPEKEIKRDIKNKISAVYVFLNNKYDFRYNTITTEVEYKEKDETSYKFFDQRAMGSVMMDIKFNNMNISLQDLEFLIGSKLAIDYDPFKQYLFSLPRWDGKTDYISQFIDNQVYLLDEENHRLYFKWIFKKWFVAMVASLIDDDVVNHTCLVLVGGQGRGKTTFLNALAPRELSSYVHNGFYSVNIKDHELMLGTKLIINLDELATFNRVDIDGLKSRITQIKINIRKPYGRAETRLYRKASFCGSINREEFLKDLTGSRRFLTIEIERIEMDKELNIDNLYSQALELYRRGYQYWFDGEDQLEVEKHNDKFQASPMIEDLFLSNFTKPSDEEVKKGSEDICYYQAGDIIAELKNKYPTLTFNDGHAQQLGQVLKKRNYTRVCKRKNNTPVYVWIVKKVYSPFLTNEDGTPIKGIIDRDINDLIF